MTSIPRGKVLVYNLNDKKRLGSEFDVKNLNNIFLRLGYKVKIIEDCTAEVVILTNSILRSCQINRYNIWCKYQVMYIQYLPYFI